MIETKELFEWVLKEPTFEVYYYYYSEHPISCMSMI
jgi:hypothetical protein